MTKKSISRDGEFSLGLLLVDENTLSTPVKFPLYTVVLIEKGSGVFKADFGSFSFKAPAILFSTPMQTLQLDGKFQSMAVLQFHGDYYCIEYHKKEVACNGVLFNNIYTEPLIALLPDEADFFKRILRDLDTELSDQNPADAVITAYLQLFLAKATSIKNKSANSRFDGSKNDEKMEMFRQLVDEHYLNIKKPAQYADLLHLSPDTLAKRCKQYFRKTPSQLIQERIILEAKKRLHLSRTSIKEIAHALKFEDEHYFSRFFKKITKVSPQTFRLKTGISIVADLSTSNPE